MRKFLRTLMVFCCIAALIRTGQPFAAFKDIHNRNNIRQEERKTQLKPADQNIESQVPKTEDTLFDGTQRHRMVAHRGLSAQYPDNSRIAFENAGRDESFWGIETDIFETADGEFICLHDGELEEGTSGSGNVTDSYSDEIQKSSFIDIGEVADRYNVKDLKIPKLRSFLDVCDFYEKVPVIELKEIRNYDKFLKSVDDFNNFGYKYIVTGADIEALKQIRSRDINIPLMLIGYEQRPYTDYTELIQKLPSNIPMTNTGILYHFHSVDKSVVDEVHGMGYLIGVWTLDSQEEIEKYESYGVDFIVTNGEE